MSASAFALLGSPLCALALCLAYPAQGRHALVVPVPGMDHGAAVGWLVDHGASITGTGRQGPILRMPTDSLAIRAAADGLLLISVPARDCSAESPTK